MNSDIPQNDDQSPIINFKATKGLKDYFCPFCGEKLFRGKVTTFNMVCSSCNKLVRSKDLNKKAENMEEKA